MFQGGIVMSKKLGNLVKEARTAKGLTQAALADKVGGITSSDVGKIERGEKEPTQDILKKMAKVLGVTQKSLLDAAQGSGAKSSSSAKTSGSGKTAAKKKTSSASSSSKTLTLTATEKKLVELYRKADSSTKKAAMNDRQKRRLLHGRRPSRISFVRQRKRHNKGTGDSRRRRRPRKPGQLTS